MANNELQLIVDKLELAPEQAKPLLDIFGYFFVEAHKIIAQSKSLVVTREDQIEEMGFAKGYRSRLRDLRIEADKARIALKEGYLRGGNAVQSIYNDIEKIIEPEENRLKEQEKFAEILKEKRLSERFVKRTEQLSKYTDNLSIYNYKDVDDESFDFLLKNVKMQYDNQLLEEKKLEKERLVREKKEIEEREKIKLENERLKKENEIKQKALDDQRKKEQIEKEKQDKILAKEREERRVIEEKIAKEKEEKERVIAEEKEKEKQLLLAPDKNKLIALAKAFEDVLIPNVTSDEAKQTIQDVVGMVGRLSIFIKKRANSL
jgi:hypothetical protein